VNTNGNILTQALADLASPLDLHYLNDNTPTKRPIKRGESEEILNMVFCDTFPLTDTKQLKSSTTTAPTTTP
jgi:hypothetical protein